MDPFAVQVSQSLHGACKHVPAFIQSVMRRLGKQQADARHYIKTFRSIRKPEDVFDDRGSGPFMVKGPLLEAMRGTQRIAQSVGNSQLAQMLQGAHCMATIGSITSLLNRYTAEGDEKSPALAAELQQFTRQFAAGGKRRTPKLNQAGAAWTSNVHDFLVEKSSEDPYAGLLADHVLDVFNDAR